jgi:hypothetical protein
MIVLAMLATINIIVARLMRLHKSQSESGPLLTVWR